MFKPVAMLRLNALVLSRDARKVLTELGRRGAVELTRAETANGATPVQSADTSRCDHLLNRIAELRRMLQSSSSSSSSSILAVEGADEELRPIEEQTAALLKKRQILLQQQTETSAICDQLTGLEGLEIPLDLRGRAEFLHFVIGTLPAENLDRLRAEIGSTSILLPQSNDGGQQTIIALASRQNRTQLDAVLDRSSFRRTTLPDASGATTASLSAEKLHEKEIAAEELGRLDAELRSLAGSSSQTLAGIEQAALAERRLIEAEQNFGRTETTSVLSGWIPASRASEIEQHVREITSNRCAIAIESPDGIPDEEIPVLLEQPRWLRPFAMLVTAFGFPKYRELEPTLFLAISYVLMFGLMFGDAGQGALLVLGGLIAFLRGRQRTNDKGQMTANVGLLLLYAGVSSAVFGVIYGSYFGLPQLKHFAIWHDPIEGNPINLMYAAIAFGIVMISLGIVLNIVNRFRRGDVIGGFLDKFGIAGVVFYWGALAILAKSAAIQTRGLMPWAIMIFLALPVVCWILREPIHVLREHGHAEKGVGLAFAESAVEAFEGVLVYLANTISFVRLAAYAMSHAALLMAFFMMAESVRHATATGSIAIIVLGNVIAIVLEGVIAAVQALRLEYYEFFGKFFSGGGRAFRPFVLWSPTT